MIIYLIETMHIKNDSQSTMFHNSEQQKKYTKDTLNNDLYFV